MAQHKRQPDRYLYSITKSDGAAPLPREGVFMARTKTAKETKYLIFKEFNLNTNQERKNLTPGHKIRVDVLSGYIWQIPEMKHCKNWIIRDKHDTGNCKTYYIDILVA